MTHPGRLAYAGRWRACVCALLACLALAADVRAERPVVLSSIRPLALMVEALAGDSVESEVLGSSGSSPHDFVLRPSERRQLAAARLVLWMGPALERPLAALLARDGAPALALLAAGETDPHVWLDPRRAADMARRMSATFVERGLLSSQEGTRRLAAFEDTLRVREIATVTALAPFRGTPFLALHDGYRPFVARYGLHQVAALPGDHERQPGARSVLTLRTTARESGARCLLRERGENRALAQALVRDLGLHAVEVDPLARDAGQGPQAFDAFLARFAEDVRRCLASSGPTTGDRS